MKRIIPFVLFALLCAFTQPAHAGLTDQLVAYYPFNGSAEDFSGNNYHGTLYGPTLTTDRFGRENRAYAFDGINDRIDITGFNLQYNKLSVSAWVLLNSNNTNGSPEIFCTADNNNSFQLEIGDQSNGKNSIMWDCLTMSNRLRTTNETFKLDNQWHLVTATWDGTTSKIYYDGVEKASRAVTGTTTLTNATLRIGCEVTANSSFWNGKIDDVRLYSRGLTSYEVGELFAAEPSSISEGMVKEYKLTSFPNPFNPTTNINFSLSEKSAVELNVFNAKGNLVSNLTKANYASGLHTIAFDATNCNSGVYFVQLKVNGKIAGINKTMLVK